MLRICSLFVCFVLAGSACADITGPIRVIDGDTLAVGGVRVRLHGIDTPEAGQPCSIGGKQAWDCGTWVSREVRAKYQGAQATCRRIGRDQYGRIVAVCQVAGHDIGRELVRSGLAFAFRRYSMAYDLEEKQAVVAGLGIHGAQMDRPDVYRKARSDQQTGGGAHPDAACRIKGNISAKGKRIFHLPGQEFYDRTRISPVKGERWFCSATEARDAGWRRARR